MTHFLCVNIYVYNITGNSGVNVCKKFKIFHNFYHILTVTELQVSVLVYK